MDEYSEEYGFSRHLPLVSPMTFRTLLKIPPVLPFSREINNLRAIQLYKEEPKMNVNIKSNLKPAPRFDDIALTTLFVMGDAVWIKTGDDNALKVESMDYRPIKIDPNAKVRRIKDLDVYLDD